MSKGNINYKYLRRRKSWFRRNIPLVIMWAVIAVVVIVLGIIGSMKLFGYGIFKNKNNDDKKVQTVNLLAMPSKVRILLRPLYSFIILHICYMFCI